MRTLQKGINSFRKAVAAAFIITVIFSIAVIYTRPTGESISGTSEGNVQHEKKKASFAEIEGVEIQKGIVKSVGISYTPPQ